MLAAAGADLRDARLGMGLEKLKGMKPWMSTVTRPSRR